MWPTVLDPAALLGVRVRVVGADTAPARRATAVAAACGAVRLTAGAADHVVVSADLASESSASIECSVSIESSAGALTAAFTAARDALPDLPDGGGLVLLVATAAAEDPVAGAVRALCRSLALEQAHRGVRVNAVIVAPGADPGALVSMLLGPAAAMLTGAVLELA